MSTFPERLEFLRLAAEEIENLRNNELYSAGRQPNICQNWKILIDEGFSGLHFKHHAIFSQMKSQSTATGTVSKGN